MWKRVFEFLLACIACRLSIMFSFIYYAHYYGNSQVLPWTGIVAFLLGTIQYTRFFCSSIPVWWNNARIVHGTMYCLYGIFAIYTKPYSWYILLADSGIGIIIYLYHIPEVIPEVIPNK